MNGRRKSVLVVLAAVAIGASGCAGHRGYSPVLCPNDIGSMPGADPSVPRELSKVTLPPYVIEPPDRLLIEVVTITEEEEDGGAPDKPKVKRAVVRDLPVQPVRNDFQVHPDGTVYLGVWGSV